jgi:hypothetical protein
MSNIDLLLLYGEYIGILYTMLGFLTTLVFAYIVANYVVVHHLSWTMYGLLTALYLILAVSIAGSLARLVSLLDNVTSQILLRIDNGDAAVAFIDPQGLEIWLPTNIFLVWSFIIAVSVGFAIKLKVDRKKSNT